MIRRLPLALGLAAATMLAACSGGSDAPPPPPNDTEDARAMDETPPQEEPAIEPSPTPTPLAAELPEAEQVQEDADAVGMTARLPRPDAEETAAPVE